MEDKIKLARINESYHKKQMEYFQEEIRILNNKHPEDCKGCPDCPAKYICNCGRIFNEINTNHNCISSTQSVKTFTEEEIFKEIDDWKEKHEEDLSDDPEGYFEELKSKFRTPQGFRRAIEREGLVGTDFSEDSKLTDSVPEKSVQNEDSKCKLCKKLKSEHIPCITNNSIFWCYDNKTEPKKWAYQFTPYDRENSNLNKSEKESK